jgi:alpha-glucosidase (family GH31 glycosyl hydrolase)
MTPSFITVSSGLRLNAAEMFVDVAKQADGSTATQWIAESGVVELFIFLGPTPRDVLTQYAKLTGTTALPQLFSIGYHQVGR